MPLQSLVWTALPNGLTADGKGCRLSVLVSPRLEPQAAPKTLAAFADFVAWPKTVGDATFTVRLGTRSVTLTSADFDGALATPDPASWAALFPSDTFVRAFAMPDRSANHVLSFDAVAMHALVRGIYGSLAASAGDDLPTIADLRAHPLLAAVADGVATLDRTFWDRTKRQRNVAGQFANFRDNGFKQLEGAAKLLAPFQLFHTPPSKPTTQTVTPASDPRTKVTWQTHERRALDAAQVVKDIDFHQIVAAMNQYPLLLRRLGLVVDFVIPRTEFIAGADLALSVSVALPPAAAGAATRRAASPVTRTRYSDTAFAPVPRPAPAAEELRVANGLLRLDPDRFALLQTDVDGAGHKLMNFARSLVAHADPRRQVDPVTKLPRTAGAPALRNAGLTLVHRQRGPALSAAFTRNKARDTAVKQAFLNPAIVQPPLHAEDLVRGWRVDIWDKTTAKWRSLCARVADYEIDGGAVTLADVREETTVRLAATTASDGNNPGVVYLHETLTAWTGWSLAARPPGRTIAPDDSVRDADAEVPNGIRLRTSFVAAPDTLPRLRYGRSYAMRARAVDLAGNSLPPSTLGYAGDEAAVAAATPYLRFAPVESPALALVRAGASVEAPAEGESMTRVAVRTFNAVFNDPALAAQSARRWAVAPRTSQREAELHGALDGAAWGGAAQFALLSTRDAELAHVDLALPGPLADPGDPVPPARYATLPANATLLPYLPDPLCTRVAARLLHHPDIDRNTVIPIDLYPGGRRWPDAAPFFVRVYEAAGETPRFDAATRTLLVPTPKAVRATLRLSAMLDAGALALMGVWGWVPEHLRTPALRQRAERGGVWALTPWREVEIVHAVQRPLLVPTMSELQLQRSLGVTWVKPGVHASVHRASTDRVDMHAAWHEPRDDASAPQDVAKADVAFAVKITDPLGYAGTPDHVVDPADTNHIAFGPTKPPPPLAVRQMPEHVHDFGDTRYRRVEYHLVGTSRFREYMPPNLLTEAPGGGPRVTTDEHITLAGPAARTWALNSAPPPAPRVLYVVPTFGWTRATDAQGKRTSWRRGGGLRVWLDRPWSASGYGEMLGVVLPPATPAVDPNEPPYKQAVTQWGNDPVWKSAFVSGVAPKPADFPLARTAPDLAGAWLPPGAPSTEADQPPGPFPTTNIRHPGLAPSAATGMVDVAPHDVFWDPDRRLWYCDIEVNHGTAYFPFIRLALARYQPASLYNAHLSNVVLADFMALTPDRWLSVTRADATRRQVRVFGRAPDESSGYHEAWLQRTQAVNPITKKVMTFIPTGIARTNVVEVWLESLAAGASEDFGWRRVSDGAPTPELTAVPNLRTKAARGAATPAATPARVTRARTLAERRQFDTLVSESLLDLAYEWPTLWNGSVTLPASSPAGTRYRVVVAEYEEYLVDDADPYTSPLQRKDRRLVFVEHVEVG